MITDIVVIVLNGGGVATLFQNLGNAMSEHHILIRTGDKNSVRHDYLQKMKDNRLSSRKPQAWEDYSAPLSTRQITSVKM
jgi:hypothetical protein